MARLSRVNKLRHNALAHWGHRVGRGRWLLLALALGLCLAAHSTDPTEADQSTLTITAGSTTPDPVAVNQTASFSFTSALTDNADKSHETPAQGVAATHYTINAGAGIITSAAAGGDAMTIAADGHSATLNSTAPPQATMSVAAAVTFSTTGSKSVTCDGNIEFNDDSALDVTATATVTVVAATTTPRPVTRAAIGTVRNVCRMTTIPRLARRIIIGMARTVW